MERDAIYVRAGTLSYWSLVALVPAAVLTVLVLRALGLESWFSFSTFAGRTLAAMLPSGMPWACPPRWMPRRSALSAS